MRRFSQLFRSGNNSKKFEQAHGAIHVITNSFGGGTSNTPMAIVENGVLLFKRSASVKNQTLVLTDGTVSNQVLDLG